jgi:LuxR family transcriptional regulator, maltose regulon positive regulatory protein
MLHGRRLGPPALDRSQLVRPRLMSALAQRWDRRLTLVIGGPGFGKSTVLAQAMAENRLAPYGTDHWVSCIAGDNDALSLCQAIGHALYLPGLAMINSADDLVGAVRNLPPGTCLFLDDVHEIDAGSAGFDLLKSFVRNLPLQCSLVIASRTFPELPMSDWMAKGFVTVLGEQDLRYSENELHKVSKQRGVKLDQETLGGWPALVELAAVTKGRGNDQYLQEVVLQRFSNDDQRRLSALNAIGGGDADLLTHALGEPVTNKDFSRLEAFPMMQAVGRSGIRPHALWHPVLQDVSSPQDRRTYRLRAAQALLLGGSHDDALTLFSQESDWDGVASVIADACKSGCTQVPLEVLDRWRNALPVEEQLRPEAKLVSGIVERERRTFAEETVVLLEEAAAAFRETGQIGAEVSALCEMTFVAREQGDIGRIATVMGRLFELEAQRSPEVVGVLKLGRAILADAFDDDQQLLVELGSLKSGELSNQWMSRVEWLRGHAHVLLGNPALGLAFAEKSWLTAEDNFLGARFLIAYVNWWISADERSIAAIPFIGHEAGATPFDKVYGGSTMATLHAFAGEIELARQGLLIAQSGALSDSSNDGGPRPEYVGLLATAEAAILVAEGRDSQAAVVLREFFSQYPASTPTGGRTARRYCGLVYTLLPEQRPHIEAAKYGPAIDDVRALTLWFVALREGKRLDKPVARPELRLLNALPLRWSVELTARWAQFDPAPAGQLAEHLVSVRGTVVRMLLREFADPSTGPVQSVDSANGAESAKNAVRAAGAEKTSLARPKEGAKRLLASVPVAPAEPLVLSLFGPLQVRRGATICDAPELRRERARQVIAALAVSGPTPREVIADWFWPELGADAAGQNLRTTLNYVNRILEPDRGPGDAAFVLRQNGDLLSLAGTPWVQTDLAMFGVAVREAEEMKRLGVHSKEIEPLELALSYVRGEPLLDVAYHDWALQYVRLLNIQITSAAQRAAELQFALSEHEAAQKHALLCLRFDPWCESANRILVASMLAQGRIAAAREAFHAWKTAQQDIGVRSTASMEMLARRLGA